MILASPQSIGVRESRDAKPYGKSTEGSFIAIERRRVVLHISQADLCREASFDKEQYSKIKRGRASPQRRTLIRLARALDRLIRHEDPPSPDMVRGFYRGACALFAKEIGLDATAVLGEAIKSRSNLDPRNVAAARCRRWAFYLTVNAFEIPRPIVQRVVGFTKQAASKALKEIEDQRDQPEFEAQFARVATILTGGPLT